MARPRPCPDAMDSSGCARFVACALAASLLAGCSTPAPPPGEGAAEPRPVEADGGAEASLSGGLTVTFLHTGAGQAVVVLAPRGGAMVVDAGPATAGDDVVAYLRGRGVDRLDAVLATHPDEDHIGGLVAVLRAFPVGRIYDPGFAAISATYQGFLDEVNRQRALHGARFVQAAEFHVGDEVPVEQGVTVTLLHPEAVDPGEGADRASLVAKVAHGDVSFLLMGDADAKVQEDHLLGLKDFLRADVLLVGRDGDAEATSAGFLDLVRPAHAVVMGSAVPEVVTWCALLTRGATVLATAETGTVTFTSDGSTLTVATDRPAGDAPACPSDRPPEDRAPIAEFSVSARSLHVTLTDSSTDPEGGPLARVFDLGDGNVSDAATFTHVYAGPGTYTITLTVTDPEGLSASRIRTLSLEEGNTAPVAGFSWQSAGLTVSFTDLSSDPEGDPVGVRWSFGDGNSSAERSPTHAYAAAGNYTVRLHASDGRLESVHEDVIRLEGEPAPPPRTGRVFLNEVELNPDGVTDCPDHEWVELFYDGEDAVDLGGWRIEGLKYGRALLLPAGSSVNAASRHFVATLPCPAPGNEFFAHDNEVVSLWNASDELADRAPLRSTTQTGFDDEDSNSKTWQRRTDGYAVEGVAWSEVWVYRLGTRGRANEVPG